MEHSLVGSFAHRLNSICSLKVVATGECATPLDEGDVFICSRTCRLAEKDGRFSLETVPLDKPAYNPLIDLLFESAAPFVRQYAILPILLTGIGEDGARGLLRLKETGTMTIAESAESAIVYGMPRSAHELGAASHVLDLDSIIESILAFEKRDV